MKSLKTSVNRGFTLAEMLLVVAILTILTAVAAPNVAKYAKGIKLRELDDSARAIYMAAQHDFKDKIAIGKELTPDDTINDVPDRYTGDSSEENIPKIDYTIYHGSRKSNGLVTVGAIEPELAANSYVIEFNAETGDVYGVFYSIKPDEFEDYAENYNDGKYAAAVNKAADRVDTLGYYGLENVAVKPAPKPGDIPTPKVNIINKEKLVLEVKNDDITLSGHLEIKVNDVDLVPRSSGAYIAPNNTAIFILDTLDDVPKDFIPSINLTDIVFEKRFADWAAGITPGSELNIEVTFYDPDGLAHDKTKRVTANSLFADGSTPDTAHVRYGRHLQNLGAEGVKTSVQTVVIDNTIDFKKPGGDKYESWDDTYGYARKFQAVSTNATNISAKSGAQIRYLNAEGGGIFASLVSADVTGIEVVNPKVTGDNSGAIVGYAYGYVGSPCTFKNCSVYVESGDGEGWDDPDDDPYSNYSVTGSTSAGGFVGTSAATEFDNCSAAVKVESEKCAGGLIGSVISGVTINNCCVLGHTYSGKFEGKISDDKDFSLRDNICGTVSAGGLIGVIDGEASTLVGTVFTSCSVSGADVNPICPTTDRITVSSGSTVFTLGKTYDVSGSEINNPELPEGVISAEEAAKKGQNFYGRRYDNRVGPVFNYPAPSALTLRGDWMTDEAITGFFYWEIEEDKYRIHALTFSGEPAEIKTICNDRDGKNIDEYGYGAFSSGSLSDVTFKDIDEGLITENEASDGIKNALGEAGVAAETVKLYDVDARGFVTATVGGSEYHFAPDFYAIYAETDDHDKHAGTDAGVYGVRCKQHLANIVNYTNDSDVKFVQSHDILPDIINMIGTAESPFKGSYDGGSYRIIDARIAAEGDYAGIFGVTDGATLENIVLFHPASTSGGFSSLAIKEEPGTSSVRIMNPVGIAAVSGAMLNESLAAVDGHYTATVKTTKVGGWVENGPRDVFEIFAPGSEEAKLFIETFKKGCNDNQTITMVSNIDHVYNPAISLILGEKDVNVFNNCGASISEKHMTFYLSSWMLPNLTLDDNKAGVYIAGAFAEAPTLTIEFPDTVGESGTTPPVEPSECEHTFDNWKYTDENQHEHICSKCNTKYFANHIGGGTWQSDDTLHWHFCADCQARYGSENHKHNNTWEYDETSHWHKCTVCGAKFDISLTHSFPEGSSKCSVCGYDNGTSGGDSNGEGGKETPANPAYAGGIVGKATGGTITNCVVAGYTLQGTSAVGGIAGESTAEISGCEANVKFAKCGDNASVGGIVGSGSRILKCYALVHGIESPSATLSLGGIAGKAASKVENCYAVFAGQTQGYPIAEREKTNAGSCYYISEEGFCSVSGDIVNSANGITLEELKNLTLGSFMPNPATYVDRVEPSEPTYQYPAIFKAGSVVEHYGPEVVKSSKAPGGKVVTGPLVGIFNLWEYDTNPSQYGGLVSYNRNGVLYVFDQAKSTKWDGSIDYNGVHHIGVIIDNTYLKRISEEDGYVYGLQDFIDGTEKHGKIEIWVDDVQINHVEQTEKFVFRNGNIDGRSQYRITKDLPDPVHAGSGQRFDGNPDSAGCMTDYYYLYDDTGKKLEQEDFEGKTITVYYTNSAGERGILIQSKWDNGAEYNEHLKGELVSAGYEYDENGLPMDTPAVGAFKSGFDSWNGLKAFGIASNTAFGDNDFPRDDNFQIGVLIAGDKVKDYEEGKLRVLLDGDEIELIPWKNTSCPSSPIANQSELDVANVNKYSAYVVKDRDIVKYYQWFGFMRFDFVYGTNFYSSVALEDNHWKMTGNGMCPLPEDSSYGFK